jgi:hypothetical protein
MTPQIRPIQQEDIPELSRFLIQGFKSPADAVYAREDVLRWKYFDPRGAQHEFMPRGFIAHQDAKIVGHAGMCPTHFLVGSGSAQTKLKTVHHIDWLAAKVGVPIGSMLAQQGFQHTQIQYGIGGTEGARKADRKMGFDDFAQVPRYTKVLRLNYRLRKPRHAPLWKAFLQTARDRGRATLRPKRSCSQHLELRRVTSFGPEVENIVSETKIAAIHSLRTSELLNHFLRYPPKTVSGWLLMQGDKPRGFALLSVVPGADMRFGKVSDCFLDCLDEEIWHCAIQTLSNELRNQGADVAMSYGTAPWMAKALEADGFCVSRFSLFALRDPQKIISHGTPLFVTPVEADHAYL